MNFSKGLVRPPEEDLDLDGHLLHVLRRRERVVVEGLDLDVVLDDLLDHGDHEVVALLPRHRTDPVAELVEHDRPLPRVHLVHEVRREGEGRDARPQTDQRVRNLVHLLMT